MQPTTWSGHAVERARAVVVQWLPAPCGWCGQPVTTEDRWVVGHKIPRSIRPDLMFAMDNWRPEHRACSDRTGQATVIAKARHDALRDAGFSPDAATVGSLRLPVSLPEGPDDALFPTDPTWHTLTSAQPGLGVTVEHRADLAWDPDYLLGFAWLAEFAVVPDDASPPLAMSPVPEDAVGSWGAEIVAWIESTQRIRLRWWQRLAIVRQHEHRADGTLCHDTVVESAPRRAGKSVRVRGVALWRMAHPEVIGETQTVMHTGSDVAICREIQRGAWRWAQGEGWDVKTGNGKESVETPDGNRWLVRAQDAVYGYDVCLGAVDEAWNVKPDTVTEGLEPATLERINAQLHLTSTAHRRATSLMRTYLTTALTEDEPGTLVLLWAAPVGSDPSDPAAWRAASPYWSDARLRYIEKKYAKALAGQADPEADDPNPMAGFTAQYLNIWSLRAPRVTRGEPLTDPDAWAALTIGRPSGLPTAVAIDAWPGHGVSVAFAWRTLGRVLVSAADAPDLDTAAALVRAMGYRGVVTLGPSLTGHPAARHLRTRDGKGRTAGVAADLDRLLTDDALRHDGAEHLARQVLNLRTMPSPDGLRVVSTGRADAVKAALWAAERARRPRSTPKILSAS